MNRWLASRWLVLTILFGGAALWLSWYLKDGSIFTAIGTVGLGGGHATNLLRTKRGESTNPVEEVNL
jgi:hypothetical protein